MKLKSVEGKAVELDDAVFASEYNETLVHQAVVAYMSAGRAGTKAQKTRSDVSGGGAKPWRQKGTGRARAGTSRGPIWRSGGVTFAARPRDYSKKLNKKMYRAAMRSIFSELVRSESLIIIDDFAISDPKTKSMVNALADWKVSSDSLLIGVEKEDNVSLSSRNIPNCEYVELAQLSPVSLVSHDSVVMTSSAVSKVQEWLS
ncbi:50S ribosomal protein L4 [Cocleimonas sp. KMM 6892]|uniref:50S ribosomal protein L4 n=1 Tax=unclassified Cocleimonas TaxID=2639732 RepID=UPI002DBB78B6|nr:MULTISPECIES: 50S ribosomal protein L4 [unclassified Cocleimonas]MEB8433318.1 50S ribosomal protein L4 [Cocleimonas sp. KMM 6892]MEC4717447.1 50S ribosomal protein L4 [Cocleimonas sp. KMM 6895]MEC4745162.1 50S ribosomal protein L4 [Cocleimonas sp. KMM 6896]